MKQINKLLTFFSKSEKKKLLILYLMMSLSALFELIGFSLIVPIITLGLKQDLSNIPIFFNLINFININNDNTLTFFILVFVSVQILKVAFMIWYLWFENKYIYSFQEKLSSKLCKKYLFNEYKKILKESSSKILRNITYSVNLVTVYLFHFLKISLDGILLIFITFFLFTFNFKITLYIFILILLFGALYNFSLRNKLHRFGKLRQIYFQDRLKTLQESFENIKYLKVTGKEYFFYNKFNDKNTKLFNLSVIGEFLKNIPKPLLELFAICVLLLFLYYSLEVNSSKTIDVFQNLAIFLAAFLKLMPSINRILTGFQSLKHSYPEVENLSSVIESSQVYEENKGDKNFFFKKHISISIKDFSHDKHRGFELKDIDLKIHKGDKVGIVGESGSGKSTLLDLIIGIQKPMLGSIIVDETPIQSNLNGWQKLIGYVPQRVGLLEDSLRNNIIFGSKVTSSSDANLMSIIKKTNLTSFFNNLDQGLDSTIFERGQNISGGEIQRIGICRAIYNNPQLLIFDEFTSSLDDDTEQQILKEIELFQDKTMILVSHKKSTLKFCKKIFQLKDGKINQIQ
jgi:ABC-type multidrug transport system fused ATPase/permease subunit